MTDMRFSAVIQGAEIHCEITPKTDFVAPVFCFSLMAPPDVVSGGTLVRTDGSYGEVQLPDLSANQPHTIVLRYAHPDYAPVNRAWLPLGAHLRTGSGIVELPKLPAGVTEMAPTGLPGIQGLGLIPEPNSWMPDVGILRLETMQPQPRYWDGLEALAQRCNLPPLQADEGIPTSIEKDADLPSEAYRMLISPSGVDITFGGAAGAHYAGVTLLVLRHIHNGQIPCGIIQDEPRFSWRGQHLDCARHYYEIGAITKLIDLMALLKMNRFHWHFSDDESFRLELESVPELAEKTGYRGEGELVPGVFGGGPRSGGTYDADDVGTVVGHAKSLFVEVLPEIEFPAHALAFARALPQTRDPDDQGDESSVQGYAKNVLNPALEPTWDIIQAIADEVSKCFPFGILHLGADELPEGTWGGSPAVERLKQDRGLETSDDVLGWALQRLAKRLAAKGIRTAAWEEAARGSNGGIGNGALLFSWTGQQAGIDAAKSGYDIVMSPAQHVYLDMAHTDDPQDWGAGWAAFVSLRDTIDWKVIPDLAIAERVMGVEGTFWSEFTTQDHQMEPMIAPRIFGVASKAWAANEVLDSSKFTNNARHFCEILSKMGWQWNAGCFDQ